MDWNGKRVLVTGGASFIGSHLVDALVRRGASVKVVDNLSSGKKANIQNLIDDGKIEFLEGDLWKLPTVQESLHGVEVVFHLAADHGGRGYVDLHQVNCARNLGLDSQFFIVCEKEGIDRIIYASSGCVYNNNLQTDVTKEIYLKEENVGPPFFADNMYGWAKLMAEMTLKAYHEERGMKTASVRYFTVYGERGKEDHAVIAMIAKAFLKHEPFRIWGNGSAIRNWTHVLDIVEGTILTAEKISDGTAVNLGTMERIRVLDAAKEVIRYARERYYPDYKPEFFFQLDMPVGPLNRVADNSLARRLLGWEPRIKFFQGLRETINWYFQTKNIDSVEETVAHKLTER